MQRHLVVNKSASTGSKLATERSWVDLLLPLLIQMQTTELTSHQMLLQTHRTSKLERISWSRWTWNLLLLVLQWLPQPLHPTLHCRRWCDRTDSCPSKSAVCWNTIPKISLEREFGRQLVHPLLLLWWQKSIHICRCPCSNTSFTPSSNTFEEQTRYWAYLKNSLPTSTYNSHRVSSLLRYYSIRLITHIRCHHTCRWLCLHSRCLHSRCLHSRCLHRRCLNHRCLHRRCLHVLSLPTLHCSQFRQYQLPAKHHHHRVDFWGQAVGPATPTTAVRATTTSTSPPSPGSNLSTPVNVSTPEPAAVISPATLDALEGMLS